MKVSAQGADGSGPAHESPTEPPQDVAEKALMIGRPGRRHASWHAWKTRSRTSCDPRWSDSSILFKGHRIFEKGQLKKLDQCVSQLGTTLMLQG